jgi:hypothetical protein
LTDFVEDWTSPSNISGDEELVPVWKSDVMELGGAKAPELLQLSLHRLDQIKICSQTGIL